MLVVNKNNFMTQVFKNFREVLLLNSDSIPVTSSFSKNSPIPIIVVNDSFSSENKYFGNNGSEDYSGVIDIRVVHTTDLKASTVGQELFNLMDTWSGTLDSYNITVIDKQPLGVIPLERGTKRYKVKPLVTTVDLNV